MAAHFRNLARHPDNPLALTPLPRLDEAITGVLAQPPEAHARSLIPLAALCGLRTTLTEHPLFFRLPPTVAAPPAPPGIPLP